MGDKKLPLVLVLDDQRTFHMLFRERLDGIVRQLHAYTIDEARDLFETHSREINVIIMDACVPGHQPTTTDLVREMRRTFRGPIIGCSSDPYNLTVMRNAGCSHSCNKADVFALLDRLEGTHS